MLMQEHFKEFSIKTTKHVKEILIISNKWKWLFYTTVDVVFETHHGMASYRGDRMRGTTDKLKNRGRATQIKQTRKLSEMQNQLKLPHNMNAIWFYYKQLGSVCLVRELTQRKHREVYLKYYLNLFSLTDAFQVNRSWKTLQTPSMAAGRPSVWSVAITWRVNGAPERSRLPGKIPEFTCITRIWLFFKSGSHVYLWSYCTTLIHLPSNCKVQRTKA